MLEHQKIKSRLFLGKIDGFIDRGERLFEQAHLKAYLRGNQFFYYGFHVTQFGQGKPMLHEVKQEYIMRADIN